MATGPEHYREAERLIGMSWENDRDYDNIAALVDRAQVHATLALVAATACRNVGFREDEMCDWVDVISTPRPTLATEVAEAVKAARAAEAKYAAGMTTNLDSTPLATAFGAAPTRFGIDDLVSISDPNHRHYGYYGRIVGYVYDPFGYAVEYDNLGSTLILAPDQLRYEASLEPAVQADAVVPIPAPRDGEQVDSENSADEAELEAAQEQYERDAEAQETAWSATDQYEHDQAAEFAADAAQERFADAENAGGDF